MSKEQMAPMPEEKLEKDNQTEENTNEYDLDPEIIQKITREEEEEIAKLPWASQIGEEQRERIIHNRLWREKYEKRHEKYNEVYKEGNKEEEERMEQEAQEANKELKKILLDAGKVAMQAVEEKYGKQSECGGVHWHIDALNKQVDCRSNKSSTRAPYGLTTDVDITVPRGEELSNKYITPPEVKLFWKVFDENAPEDLDYIY